MNREQYIKELIALKKLTIKSFAASIDMPYSTLLSMLNGSIGGAAIDSVIRICKGLDITVSDLQSHSKEGEVVNDIVITEHEKELVLSYRDKPEMQKSVDKLLDINI